MRIRFLRVNERHHSVAIAGIHGLGVDPIRTTIQHLNTQVSTLDGLLAAYERVIDHGFRMQWSVGQHTNDRELSFYCVTPSGFEWELGWNPIVVTAEQEPTSTTSGMPSAQLVAASPPCPPSEPREGVS